jgi:hypothetical protein
MAERVLQVGQNHIRIVAVMGVNGSGRTPLPFAHQASLRYSPLMGENKETQPTAGQLTDPSGTNSKRSPEG